jgi:hypothetical protein
MANEYYSASGAPSQGSTGASSVMRAEFNALVAAFDKLPTLAANAGKVVAVNSGATGLTVSSAIVISGANVTIGGVLTASGGVTGNLTGAVTGNATTATTLQTARNINGVSFNGSADITVAAAAGTLTGATLAAGVTASSLTSFGASIALGTPASGNLANCTFPTLNQSTSGNAATATTLQTARNINGVSFNGSADITVAAAAGTLTGTTLAAGVTASSLTSVAAAATVGGIEIGFRRALAGSVTTGSISASDSGKAIYATAGVTIPNGTFVQGDIVTIYNTTAGTVTITISTTTSFWKGATTGGSKILAAHGAMTVIFGSSTECIVSGDLS